MSNFIRLTGRDRFLGNYREMVALRLDGKGRRWTLLTDVVNWNDKGIVKD